MVQVAEETEARDVGGGAGAGREGGVLGPLVECRHRRYHASEVGVAEPLLLDGLGGDSEAERLAEHQAVADPSVCLGQRSLAVDPSQHAQAVLELRVDYGVPAHDGAARLGRLVSAAAEDAPEHLHRHFALGESADRQCDLRLASHGVDVGERVGDGDGAEGLRVVDDGRDEVHGEGEERAVLGAHEGRILHGTHVGFDPGVIEGSDLR